MNFTSLLMSNEEGITTITINRAKQANALNWETIGELKQAVEVTRVCPRLEWSLSPAQESERLREDCETPYYQNSDQRFARLSR